MKPLAYVSGALTDMPEEDRAKYKSFYEEVGAVCAEHGYEPYCPHVYSDPKTAAHLSPQEVDQIDRQAVMQSRIVVAYVGTPSLGVGIELEMCHHGNKPLVLLFEKDRLDARRISRLARGNPAVVHEIAFIDFADAKYQLGEFLAGFAKHPSLESLPKLLRTPLPF